MSAKLRGEKTKTKWNQMHKLLDAVKQKPLTISEACAILPVSKRMVEIYFAELKALGLITYDPETKIYELAGIQKQVFESKHDYDLALKHSRLLVFSTKETQRFDAIDPFLAVDLLTFCDDPLNRDIDNKCVVQHLKTGYYKEVYVSMQTYRQLLDENGISKRGTLPKLCSSEFVLDATPSELMSQVPLLKDEYVNVPIDSGLEVSKHKLTQVSRKKLKEIYDLRNLLVGKLYSIVNDVRNGIPIQGYCDQCPHRKLTIKE